MKVDYETYSLLEDYLRGRLEPEAEFELEERLEREPVLREELTFLREVVEESIKSFGRGAPAQTKRKQRIKHRKVILFLAAVASLALLAVILLSGGTDPHQKLYAEYFSPDPRADLSLGLGKAEKIYRNACNAYRLGDFEEAIPLYEEYVELQPDSLKGKYFLALSHLALEQIQNGLPLLLELSKDPPKAFKRDIAWYMALAHLYNGDLQDCRVLLMGIQGDSASVYQGKARKLLEEINSLE